MFMYLGLPSRTVQPFLYLVYIYIIKMHCERGRAVIVDIPSCHYVMITWQDVVLLPQLTAIVGSPFNCYKTSVIMRLNISLLRIGRRGHWTQTCSVVVFSIFNYLSCTVSPFLSLFLGVCSLFNEQSVALSDDQLDLYCLLICLSGCCSGQR